MIILAYIIIGLTVIILGAIFTDATDQKDSTTSVVCGAACLLVFVLSFIQQINIIMAG